MTRKDFALVAAALLNAKPIREGDPAVYHISMRAWARVIRKMTDALCSTSPGFRRDRFVSACGFDPEEE